MAKNPTDKQLKELVEPNHQITPGANLKKYKAVQAKLLDVAKAVRDALPEEPAVAAPLYTAVNAAAVKNAEVFSKRAGVELPGAKPPKVKAQKPPVAPSAPLSNALNALAESSKDPAGPAVLVPEIPAPPEAPAGSSIPPDSDGGK